MQLLETNPRSRVCRDPESKQSIVRDIQSNDGQCSIQHVACSTQCSSKYRRVHPILAKPLVDCRLRRSSPHPAQSWFFSPHSFTHTHTLSLSDNRDTGRHRQHVPPHLQCNQCPPLDNSLPHHSDHLSARPLSHRRATCPLDPNALYS